MGEGYEVVQGTGESNGVWHDSRESESVSLGQSRVYTFRVYVTCARFRRIHVCVQFACTR